MRIYAHRGVPAERPENTLPSFDLAAELGVEWIETDVHTTADGHVVVSHDPDGWRMAGTKMRWREVSLAQAQRCDVGWGFVAADGARPYAGQNITIPTFAELLERYPAMNFNVDLKQHDQAMIDAMLALLQRLGAEHRVALASFSSHMTKQLRDRGYRGTVVLAQADVLRFVATPSLLWRQKWSGGAAQVPLNAGPLRFDSEWFVKKCKKAGIRCDFWTINDLATAKRLHQLGADGVMTDDARTILQLVR